ncbi:RNA polymerase sigma factor [Thiomicrorhabdus sp. 6S2-11]|jgi:RNA polymerase sigma-70 factor (ECF subfamily)|uniref:RNA polymerase sigma factor n=1 Tax=Thiomicrorhabdus marina TaxID=2818442 RepID=A0ABS3Q742_9GAMM|nr:RNA polymerase sigma factor [Thiomicrorhabdus marina]MBO1928175.1 RNA polymerase sigma factor [Thiomicrorhabdus marina]
MKLTSKVAKLICGARDRKLFDKALKQQYDGLYRIAYAWCHQSAIAQDLVQETMLKALENQEDLDSLQHLKAWLVKIMRNMFLDEMRFKNRWQWVEETEIDQHHCAQCSESELLKSQRNELLYRAMAQLPFEQREAITLVDLQGFSYQEIADITATPVGTVMSRISRGRQRLKNLLEHDLHPKVVSIRRI